MEEACVVAIVEGRTPSCPGSCVVVGIVFYVQGPHPLPNPPCCTTLGPPTPVCNRAPFAVTNRTCFQCGQAWMSVSQRRMHKNDNKLPVFWLTLALSPRWGPFTLAVRVKTVNSQMRLGPWGGIFFIALLVWKHPLKHTATFLLPALAHAQGLGVKQTFRIRPRGQPVTDLDFLYLSSTTLFVARTLCIGTTFSAPDWISIRFWTWLDWQ